MTTTKNTKTTAAQKLASKADSVSLDMALTCLVQVDAGKTVDKMIVRLALIESIERRYPAIATWLEGFYEGEDDAPCWDVSYVDAILLARDELGL